MKDKEPFDPKKGKGYITRDIKPEAIEAMRNAALAVGMSRLLDEEGKTIKFPKKAKKLAPVWLPERTQ